MSRIDRLRASLEEALLVSNGPNVRYLTGFESSNAALLVEPERVRLFSDFRYAEAGRAVAGVEFVETRRNLYAGLAEQLSGRIGFEAADLTYARWETLRGGGLELVARSGIVERLRAVKDDRELDAIRRAAELAGRGLDRLVQEPFVGKTEAELAWMLERFIREEGADGHAFEIGLGSGPNGALPHAHPGKRRIEANELVIVDFGATVDGYRSDCTRTFATGDLEEDLRRIYDVCLEAQEAALAAVRAGAHGNDVDAVARDRISEAGYGDQFGHGLGHGVGLLVHEAPTLRPESEDTLEPGNVVTVEPGIYLPGRGGVRIEDLVVVTDGEPEVLTSFTKQLVTVG